MRLLSLIAIIFSLLLGPALADGHGVVTFIVQGTMTVIFNYMTNSQQKLE